MILNVFIVHIANLYLINGYLFRQIDQIGICFFTPRPTTLDDQLSYILIEYLGFQSFMCTTDTLWAFMFDFSTLDFSVRDRKSLKYLRVEMKKERRRRTFIDRSGTDCYVLGSSLVVLKVFESQTSLPETNREEFVHTWDSGKTTGSLLQCTNEKEPLTTNSSKNLFPWSHPGSLPCRKSFCPL